MGCKRQLFAPSLFLSLLGVGDQALAAGAEPWARNRHGTFLLSLPLPLPLPLRRTTCHGIVFHPAKANRLGRSSLGRAHTGSHVSKYQFSGNQGTLRAPYHQGIGPGKESAICSFSRRRPCRSLFSSICSDAALTFVPAIRQATARMNTCARVIVSIWQYRLPKTAVVHILP